MESQVSYHPPERPISVCTRCGAAVGDPAVHNHWHLQLEGTFAELAEFIVRVA